MEKTHHAPRTTHHAPLKFCMVTTFFPPYNFGGDGIFVYRLTNALARLGHTVHVVHDVDAFGLFSDKPASAVYPMHDNVVLHPLRGGKRAGLDLFASHQLGRPVSKHKQIKVILEGHDFDVIHFHNISLLGGPHILAYGNERAIKLCTTHDHWFVCAMHVLWRFDKEACTKRTCLACTLHGRRPPQLWRYTGAVARAAKHIDAFIAPTEFARQNHLRNGFPTDLRPLLYFMPDSEVERLQGLTGEFSHPRPYFLFVGRLEKIKGLQVVIDVFKTYDKADLLIAGTGTYEAELRAMAEGLSHVHFLGFLDHSVLRSLYDQAIATIVPSICFETFGWITLESFIMRTPAIVHDFGALAEVVSDGGGFAYRTTEEMVAAMEQLRTQPELRHEMGEAAYGSYLRNFTEAVHLENYFALISELGGVGRR